MRRPNVVTIGGGTGSFMLLSGLKKYPINLSAVVSMADDGGSTGVLRDELGVLPPGDVRQCLVALSESSEMMRKLMNYRFSQGGLKGHSFGNLFLSALEKINHNFGRALEEAAHILKAKGEVVPVTNENVVLRMKLKNGKVIKGEHKINTSSEVQKFGISQIYLKPYPKANPKALKKIREADLIIIGPGNHYCSVVPNFLVAGIPEAIRKSKAQVVYNCNLVNKTKHTEKYTLEDYVEEIEKYIGSKRVDFSIFNTQKPNKKLIARYEKAKELLVGLRDCNKGNSYKIIKGDVLSDQKPKYSVADRIASRRSFIRHDSDKLARIIMRIINKKK